MLKQYTLMAGCSLALILAACSPPAAEQTPAATPQAEQVKPAGPESRTRPEGQDPRTQEGRPRQGPDGVRRAPPEIAYTACEGLAASAACSFETPRGTRTGVCQTRPGETRAVCFFERPAGERPPRPRPAGE